VDVLTANRVPFQEPKYAVPLTTARESVTPPEVWNVHSGANWDTLLKFTTLSSGFAPVRWLLNPRVGQDPAAVPMVESGVPTAGGRFEEKGRGEAEDTDP
jgi:hypothetical protein